MLFRSRSSTGKLLRACWTDLKGDLKAAKKFRLPWWVILGLIAGGFFGSLLFDKFGRRYSAIPIVDSIFVFGLLVRLKWELRRERWFWITITVLAAIHVPLIMFIPWDERLFARGPNAGIMTLDACAMFVIFSVVRQCVRGQNDLKHKPPQTTT